jgi:PTH1 family peptidyl-tRNA hydrolase
MCGPEIRMVVGLGNPGEEYVGTRHNMGFRVVDSLAEALKIEVRKKKFGAVYGQGEFEGKKLILLKPWRFMNRSGHVVATVAGFYELGAGDLLVITDDMALSPGRIRIRAKGTAGGHKGLADIVERLGTESVGRLRIGIGESRMEAAEDFVLDRPTDEERKLIEEGIEKAKEAVICWIENGIQAAMNEFNEG